MKAFRPSRQTGQLAIQDTPLDGQRPRSQEAALSIRLWRTGGAVEPGELLWESNDPAVRLALDLIAASHGIVSAPHGRILVATFPGLQPAILTARRLQWAIQGLSEAEAFAGTAAAVAVHSSQDLPGQEADNSPLSPLEHAQPGQVLLTPKASELLQDLPGLPLKADSETGECELLWRDSEQGWSRQSDEETLSQFIQLNGLEHEAPAALPANPLPDESGGGLPESADEEKADSPAPGNSASRLHINQRLLIGVGCAAAIVLIVVAIIAVSRNSRSGSASKSTPPAPASSASLPSAGEPSQSPSTNPAPTVQTGTLAGPGEHDRQAQNGRRQEEAGQSKRTASEALKPQATAPKAIGDNCDLLPKMLDQAERSREQGNYPDAERQFRAVLACDHNNARAQNGLNRVLLARQAEKQANSP